MQTKKNKYVHLVIVDECFDYESDIKVFAFTTHKKATEFYNEELKKFKDKDVSYGDITDNPGYFCAFDEGWYNRDHYCIYVEAKEVL